MCDDHHIPTSNNTKCHDLVQEIVGFDTVLRIIGAGGDWLGLVGVSREWFAGLRWAGALVRGWLLSAAV